MSKKKKKKNPPELIDWQEGAITPAEPEEQTWEQQSAEELRDWQPPMVKRDTVKAKPQEGGKSWWDSVGEWIGGLTDVATQSSAQEQAVWRPRML